MCAAQANQKESLKVHIQAYISIHSCNGKSSCSINVRNSVFGDPCPGTYKYLELAYTCQLPESRSGKGHTVACEGSVAQLKCVQGRVISVQSAVYGRRDKTTCATGRPASKIQNVRCSSQSKRVAESCNGKSSCSINVRNSVFGDPCPGTYKYLELAYTCQFQGRVISVQSAVYGRRDKTTCATGRPASQIQNVRCSSQSKRVAESCNGKSSCSINVRNSVFGDPCRGTYKYLELAYTCQFQGRVISVQSAVYGRRDKTTCATGRPASQIQNVRCSSQSKRVAESCNGKSSCSINVRNSVFGDPCPGTYKYLELAYTCQCKWLKDHLELYYF
ncbi:L-rhamnose-binding lectin CSL3-like [Odontesthes bonariensis]|uniref:L-rhamnose-binding lectin CSL3-like n=1 Tax=Odontesthes bonariensis TaxID=219752 RepID=UPI003F58EB5B